MQSEEEKLDIEIRKEAELDELRARVEAEHAARKLAEQEAIDLRHRRATEEGQLTTLYCDHHDCDQLTFTSRPQRRGQVARGAGEGETAGGLTAAREGGPRAGAGRCREADLRAGTILGVSWLMPDKAIQFFFRTSRLVRRKR